MSSACGSCDCADKNQCGKGNQYGVEIFETEQMSNIDSMMMDAENDCKCCGSSCACTNCTCCTH
ncbi:hypothetical protein V2J09_007339 [Rumex salicifolius]